MKIVTVLGARPQFIKAALVSRAITEFNAAAQQPQSFIEEVVVHTGQHFDANMSDVFFSELGIAKPAHQLDIHGGTHGSMTGRMLDQVERVLLAEKPDAVMVYGDTNSTLAGALAAVKLLIPVIHVEAGLRSYNMAMPEEINRIIADRLSSILFCPTETAVENLVREGFSLAREGGTTEVEDSASNPQPLIYNIGDVMYDVALHFGAKVSSDGGLLQQLRLKPKEYILSTIHRAENTDHPNRLKNVLDALAEISKEIKVVLPLHPRTRKILQSETNQISLASPNLILVDPVGYLDMVQLEKYAALIATDSGGVQKEAFFHKVPCVTLRDETEWVELVEAGWNRLAPPVGMQSVVDAIRSGLGSVGKEIKPYGDGNATEKIVAHLVNGLQI